MCGIFGFISHREDTYLDRKIFDRCISVLSHRGPDATGTYIGPGFGFSHCRLAIIDLDPRSNQPFVDEETGVVISYNGEVYNYREVRRRLEIDGCRFRTESDTEVICKAFARWGIDCLKHFRGMFAFAMFDPRSRSTYLARDRLGIKPLYYAETDKGLLFASQPAALFEWPGISKKIDPTGVSGFLSFRAVLGEGSLFQGVKKLAPGTWLKVDGRDRSISNWWSLAEHDGNSDSIEDLLGSAVEEHLVADTPIATLLSGGLDSSVLAHEVTRQSELRPTCFTGVVPGDDYDESKFAAEVASNLGVPHQLVDLPNATSLQLVNQLVALRYHPLGMHNETAMYLLSQAVSNNYKVLLTGEGADEIFAGYSRIFRMPFDVRRNDALSLIPGRLGRFLRRRIEIPEHGSTEFEIFLSRYSYFPVAEKIAIANSRWSIELDGDRKVIEWLRNAYIGGGTHAGARITNFFIRHHLPALLEMVDNATMAAGIEARVPFTDHRLVQRACALKPSKRLRWNSPIAPIEAFFKPISAFSEHLDTSKAVLRETYANVLPASVIHRKKLGFPLPLGRWAVGTEAGSFRDLLFKGIPAVSEYFDMGALRNWYERRSQTPSDAFGKQFWLLTNLEIFLRHVNC